ncbi:non-ribosomal peptide synthetase, partial [Pseudomonas ogarae]
MERSVEMVVALLGIVHAGAAWLPLDPELPAARLAFLIEDADAKVTLTQVQWLSRLPAGHQAWTLDALPQAPAFEPINVEAHDLAYVLYTSGSTGQPKGVMNEHGALMNRLHWMQDAFPIGPNDRVLQKTPYSFDVSVWEFFWPLITGATLVVARPDGHRDPAYLSQLIQQERVTTLHFVPSMLRAFVEEPSLVDCQSLRQVFASGEALPMDLVRRFMGQHPAALVNLYGPTEAAIDVSVWRCSADDAIVPIGKPIANLRLYILDEAMQPLPIGSIGELYIGGVGVARGYLKRPDLTEERFLVSPFVAGDRLYRTGDRCRFLADGNVEYLGRLDHQVKLRGQRIELGEIDAALLPQAGVRDAATLLLDQRLVSFWCGDADEVTLRADLSDSLPAHMQPSLFMQLDNLPLNSNGKLDRKALAATALPNIDDSQPHVAPRNATEAVLSRLFCEVLERPDVSVHDNFFSLGGHSLLAAMLFTRLRQRFTRVPPLRSLFENPTLSAFASQLGDPLDTPASTWTGVSRPSRLPLSFEQQRLWFLEQLSTGGGEYNVVSAVQLDGALNVQALRTALNSVVQRHEILRSRIVRDSDGELALVIEPQVDISLQVTALQATSDEQWQQLTDAAIHAETGRRFDLAAEVPLRATLLQRSGAAQSLLLLNVHHCATDDASSQNLLDELRQLYTAQCQGAPAALPGLALQYPDYAIWQREPGQQTAFSSQLEYWCNQLEDGDYLLDLPTEQGRPNQLAPAAGAVQLQLPPVLVERLRQFAQQRGATLYMLMLGAAQLLLGRYANQRDVRVGSPVAQRPFAELQPLIGCFVNTVVMRADLDPALDFEGLLDQVRNRVLDAQQHQDVPFEQVVEHLKPSRSLGQTPLFQVLFAMQNADSSSQPWPQLQVSERAVTAQATKYDLNWEVHDGEVLSVLLEYRAALFSETTARRWLEQWQQLLEAMLETPQTRLRDWTPLPAAERHRQLIEWNATERHYSGPTNLHTALSQQATLSPNAPALVFEGQRLTYAELDQRAQAVARALRAAGVGTDNIVPLCMERSVEMVVALLGIVHAGAAWLPLDPELPAARLAFLIEDADAKVTLTQAQWLSRLPAGHQAWTLDALPQAPAFEPINVEAHDLAYVLYTSGSTGQPKGV